jgi:DNA polymerase-3 subunit beta
MKVICTQENLKNGLVTASKIINQSSTLPILSNILLETKNGSLTLQGTNLEVGIKTTVRCKIELEGSFCINAKLFTDLISTLPSQNITLEAVSGGCVLNATIDLYACCTLKPKNDGKIRFSAPEQLF